MKNVTLTLLILSLASVSFSQIHDHIPNNLFDHWDNTPEKKVGGITYPEYDIPAPDHFWTSGNPSTRTISYTPPLTKTTDAYEGKYAALMKSESFAFGTAAGALMTGRYAGGLNPDKVIDWGVAWNGRPERFVGYYKYIPVDNDKCRGWIMFTKYSNGRRDTLGEVHFPAAMEAATVTNYTKFDLPIVYRSTDEPDTIIMSLTSSFDGNNYNGGIGSALYIDKLLLLYPGETAINYTEKENAHFWVYPNPAISKINFTIDPDFADNSEVIIINSSGQKVDTFLTQGEFNEFDIAHYPSGTYFFEVMHNGNQVSKGKFQKQ